MKKRIISFIALIILIFNFSCVPSFAGTDNTIITVSSVQAKAGETVEIPVILSGNTGFSNLAIEIGYNSNIMILTSVTSSVSGASFTTAPNIEANPYNMQWDNASDVMYNGTLAVLTFQVKDSTENGTYPVTVNFYKGRNGNNVDGDDVNYRANYEPLMLTYKNGGVTIANESVIPEEGSVCVQAQNVFAKSGETVELPIILSGNTGFSNLAIEIGYNSSIMILTNVASSVSGASFTTAQNIDANPYNMQWDNASDVTYNGTLATLTFTVKDNAPDGAYPVTVNFYKGRNGNNVDGDDVNYRANYEPLNLKYENGSVTVSKQAQTEKSIEVSDLFDGDIVTANVHLYGIDKDNAGKVYVGAYYDNKLISVNVYDAKKDLEISISKNISDTLKVMWWNNNMTPMCKCVIWKLR